MENAELMCVMVTFDMVPPSAAISKHGSNEPGGSSSSNDIMMEQSPLLAATRRFLRDLSNVPKQS